MAPAGRSVPESHFSIRLIIGTEGAARHWCGKWRIRSDLLYLISLENLPFSQTKNVWRRLSCWAVDCYNNLIEWFLFCCVILQLLMPQHESRKYVGKEALVERRASSDKIIVSVIPHLSLINWSIMINTSLYFIANNNYIFQCFISCSKDAIVYW